MGMELQDVCPTTPLQLEKHIKNNNIVPLSYATHKNLTQNRVKVKNEM